MARYVSPLSYSPKWAVHFGEPPKKLSISSNERGPQSSLYDGERGSSGSFFFPVKSFYYVARDLM